MTSKRRPGRPHRNGNSGKSGPLKVQGPTKPGAKPTASRGPSGGKTNIAKSNSSGADLLWPSHWSQIFLFWRESAGRRWMSTPLLAAFLVAFFSFAVFLYPNFDRTTGVMGPLGTLRQLGFLLALPGLAVLRLTGKLSCGGMPVTSALVVSALDWFFYWLLFVAAKLWWRQVALRRSAGGSWLGKGELIFLSLLFLLTSGSWLVLRKDVENVQTSTYPVAIKDLPSSLAGLKVVQISDLHCGSWQRPSYRQKLEKLIADLQPDIICCTGDYVYSGHHSYPQAAQFLRSLSPKIALVGVLGNHDYWQDVDNAYQLFPATGLKLIDNGRLFVNNNRQLVEMPPSQGLCLAGLGDSWEGQVDFASALAGVSENMPRLVMAHNPEVVLDRRVAKYRLDLLITGHTHGGQVSLPFFGPLGVPSGPARSLVIGWHYFPNLAMYINPGLGETVLPLRCGVPPEITVFILQKGE